MVGLANVRGLCRKTGNTGFTKTQLVNKVIITDFASWLLGNSGFTKTQLVNKVIIQISLLGS